MKYNFELECDSVDDIVRQALMDQVLYEKNPKLVESLNRVIAYFSVPGTWEDGKYDLDAML